MPWKIPLITAVAQAIGSRLSKDNIKSKSTKAAAALAVPAAVLSVAPEAFNLPSDDPAYLTAQAIIWAVIAGLAWHKERKAAE